MVNLFVVSSSLEDLKSLESRTSEIVNKIVSDKNEISFAGYFNNSKSITDLSSNFDFNKPTIIINSSGGTEDLILTITQLCKSFVLIFANPNRNSFASSLEAYAYLKENYQVKLFYSENDEEKIDEAAKFLKAVKAISKINKSKFGLIGEPSDWLLTSREFNGFGNFNTSVENVKVDELVQLVANIDDNEALQIVRKWKLTYKEILVDEKSLIDSAKVYIGIKKLINNHNLNSLSIRCFDLLDYNYTACMALSMLNDEGIISGCEGDLPTTFTMMTASFLSEKVVWMANPSSINKEENEIVFAHCTVPAKFLENIDQAGLTTHMESNKSTALRGTLKNSEVTVLRFSRNFDKLTSAKGKIVKSDMKNINLCRTQAVIKLNGNVEDWMNNALGNHHVIVYGDLTAEVNYFCELSKTELIEIN